MRRTIKDAAHRAREPAGRVASVRERGRGQGRLLLISGEAGVGKSVLLEEFAAELPDVRWPWAGCDGLFTPAGLGPLPNIATQIDGELLRLCRAEAKRDQLYGALILQLGELQNLTTITVEDVHWADEATLAPTSCPPPFAMPYSAPTRMLPPPARDKLDTAG
jgi:hypothetical protein